MKKGLIITIVTLSIAALSTIGITGCGQQQALEKQVAVIKPGDLQITISADGNLVMPHEANLAFGTYGQVKSIPVKEGDDVKAGTLLAKLDDTVQKTYVALALYNVELALNELAERVYPSILGYPHYYPNTSVVLRIKQAQEELNEAQELLAQDKQKDAASVLHIAQYDLEASLDTLKTAIKDIPLPQPEDELSSVYSMASSNMQDLINLIEQDLMTLSSVQNLIEQGDYANASYKLALACQSIETTYNIAQKVCGQVTLLGISYPDTATSLDSLETVEDNLKEIQKLMETDNYDRAELAGILRMTQHDLEISRQILEENDLILKNGVNLKVLRQNNLNLQYYETALKQYKEDLMKTEILAPFDGTVISINVKENEWLSAPQYPSSSAIAAAGSKQGPISSAASSAITVVHLVDTKWVELDGVVDEIDIFKVKVGQKAIITVDALPGQELTGTVTFISPYGTGEMGVVNYKVTVRLDPTELELKGGLTATANIIVDNKENVLLIPNGAIKGTYGDYWTQVVTGGIKDDIEKRQIVLGIQNGLFSEVVSGLKEGEKVLVEKTTSTTRSILK